MSPAIPLRAAFLARAILALIATCLSAALAFAGALVTPNDMKSGALLFKSGTEGQYVEAPKIATDIDVTISGPTARTRVTQRFMNPAKGWAEGIYVFPLPDNSAVDTMKMVIGNRVIMGEIKEKQEAKLIYEEAKAQGQTAALLEQERPNLFTNSVANIGPGESIVIQIEYQETIRQSDGVHTLRLPLVVAPRYTGAPVVQSVDFDASGHGFAKVNDPVPDRDRISPPVLDPRKHKPVNPTTISVHLAAGFALGEVKSYHHEIVLNSISDDRREISLKDDAVIANKDFELTWAPKPGAIPAAGLFQQKVNGETYLLGYVTPPTVDTRDDKRPREMVLVIDNSGSMGGPSMTQAKNSLLYALGRLTPQDRFNVIRFDDTMETVFDDTVQATPENIARAKAFVAALEANGGTEMVPPMRAALADPRPRDGGFLRQVVFLTDGAIGDEQTLFNVIASGRGRSRIFMVGIGSAPNTFLMTRASEMGRGTFTHIGETEQVDDRMRDLFGKLERPAVTELTSDLKAPAAEVAPQNLPDLYRGEPVMFIARAKSLPATVTLNGRIGEQPWQVTLPTAKAAPGTGLDKLWARRRIDDTEAAITLGQMTLQDAEKRILSLALDHGLVSRLTSLVAVDKTPRRPAGEKLSRADIPLNLPAGWDYDKVFGEQAIPQDIERHTEADVRLIAVSNQPGTKHNGSEIIVLPQGGTLADLFLLIGAVMMALSLVVLRPSFKFRPQGGGWGF
jgi:Ca-activated chloride channel homolog